MQWDWSSRSLHLGVAELASFDLLAPADAPAGRWRAELGTHWHDQLRRQAEAGSPDWQFERPVGGLLQRKGWSFHLRGRMDQWWPGPEAPRLREMKTIQQPLPAAENDLRLTYPAYFHQTQLYRWLLQHEQPECASLSPAAELVFLEIQTGLSQIVPLRESDAEALQAHLDRVVDLLEERRRHFQQLRSFSVPAPFPNWREGQEILREQLETRLRHPGPLALEAPTGFGKTGLALEQALRALCSGQVERILLLTGKTSGQSPLLHQLERFLDADAGPTVLPLRSRRDLALPGEESTPYPSVSDMRRRWEQSGFSAPAFLQDHIPRLEELRTLGSQLGIPPYFITRLLMPYADIWIADYNYLFDPVVSSVFENLAAFRPDRSFLVIDEAHNLPARAASSRSHLLRAADLEAVLTELRFLRFPGRLENLCDQLLSRLRHLQPTDQLDPPDEADFLELLESVATAYREAAFSSDEWSPALRDFLGRIPALLADLKCTHSTHLVHAPQRGCLHFACLGCAPAIREVLTSFRQCLLMSATLQPAADFAGPIGLPLQQDQPSPDAPASKSTLRFLQARSPYLPDCFFGVVDARVDTRYRRRAASAPTIMDTLAATVEAARGCAVAFFPSYAYARQIMDGLRQRHPGVRVNLQPRDLPLEEEWSFIESSLLMDDLLFVVLGSRFSEGVDALGGRVQTAMVVGPALPEVNAVQQARQDQLPGSREERFHTVYRVPGIRKIAQALGRLVREPEHRARVLLIGQRFAEPAYSGLLPEYLQPRQVITTKADLREYWLNNL